MSENYKLTIMKELSTEEKARAYDKLFVKAQQIYNKENDVLILHTIEDLFPEIKQSEDEGIRKEILEYFQQFENEELRGVNISDWIAWLEKQGEQKPTIEMKSAEESLGIDSETYNKIVDKCIWGEQKPAWSEEDEFELENVLCHLRNYLHKDSYIRYENWLKSLKDRVQPNPKWKPSDEQMVTLEFYMHILVCNRYKETLFSLYEDLKKLREE